MTTTDMQQRRQYQSFLLSLYEKARPFPSWKMTLLYCIFVLPLDPTTLRNEGTPDQGEPKAVYGWAEGELLYEQGWLLLCQLPRQKESSDSLHLSRRKVGCCCSLLCCFCNEFNCRNTSRISNKSLYSPSGSQDNKHDFLIYWALLSFIFAIFLIYFLFF